jgi:hypothetical protein
MLTPYTLTAKALAKASLIGVILSVAACAPRYPTSQQPVNQANYNQDLANCQQQAASSFSFGNAVTECMRARGYNVN